MKVALVGGVVLAVGMSVGCGGDFPLEEGKANSTLQSPAATVADRNGEVHAAPLPYHPAPASFYEAGRIPVKKTKEEFLAFYNTRHRLDGRPDFDPTVFVPKVGAR